MRCAGDHVYKTLRAAVGLDTARRAWDPGPWHDYANDDYAAYAEVFDDVSILSHI